MSSPADSALERRSLLPAFELAVLAFAVLALGFAGLHAHAISGALGFGLLLIFALVTERVEVNVGPLTATGGFLPAVAACVLYPGLAPVLGLAALFCNYPSLRSRLVNTAMSVLACSAGAMATQVVSSALDSVPATIAAGSVATVGFVLTNGVLGTMCAWAIGHREIRMIALSMTASGVATALFFMPAVGAFCALVLWMGTWIIPVLLIPLALCQYFLSLYSRKMELTGELMEKAQILAKTNLQFAAAMVKALDARDAYTAGHSAAVAVYTRDIAREMGFDDETVRVAHLAGLLHDIGKIGVPGRVLNKTAPLDDEEYEIMKSHAAMGAEILGEVDLYSEIASIVRYHHERIDGKGYPDRLEGEAIPAISRMISVADTYSAMTTDRPYREGMPTEKAMSILRECRGTQLDQDFTDAFLRILIVADEAYQRGKQTDFEVEVAKHQALSEVEAEAVRVAAPALEPVVPVVPAITPDGDEIEVPLEREAA